MALGTDNAAPLIPGGVLASGDFTSTGTLDPVNGTYTVNGSSVTLADLIDEGNSAFDQVNNIDAGGIKLIGGSGISLVFDDPLRSSLLSGFSLALVVDTDVGTVGVDVYSEDFSTNSTVYVGFDKANLAAEGGTPNQDYVGQALTAGENIIRMTMDATHIAISVNGAGADSFAHPGIFDGATYPMFSFSGLGADGRVKSFVFYEPVDDADLPTLTA